MLVIYNISKNFFPNLNLNNLNIMITFVHYKNHE